MMYRISLTADCTWILTSDQETRDWTCRFAQICGFPPVDTDSPMNYPFIHIRGGNGALLPGMTTRFSDTFLKIYESSDCRNWVIALNTEYCREQASWALQMNWALYPVYYELIKNGGVMVHASFLEWDGKGVLIIAPGGTGKSTCAKRIPDSWNALCDDLVLLIPTPSGWFGRPAPTWSEYLWGESSDLTWEFERFIQVHLLCYLNQGETDRIRQIGTGEAAHLQYQAGTDNLLSIINRGEHSDKDRLWWRKEIFHTVSRVVREIPVCHLDATRDGRFWEVIEQHLRMLDDLNAGRVTPDE